MRLRSRRMTPGLAGVRGFSSPIKLDEMMIALAGNAHKSHRADDDVAGGIGAAQRARVDEEAVQRLRVVVEVFELHDELTRRRRMHAGTERSQHHGIRLLLAVCLSKEKHG